MQAVWTPLQTIDSELFYAKCSPLRDSRFIKNRNENKVVFWSFSPPTNHGLIIFIFAAPAQSQPEVGLEKASVLGDNSQSWGGGSESPIAHETFMTK